MSSSVIVFSPACDRARPHLLLFSAYALVGGTLLIVNPSLMLDFPLLEPIERLTGMRHMPVPTTPEGQQFVTTLGLVVSGIGLIYAIHSGPYWHHGGKVYAKTSIDGRLIFAVVAVAMSLFTNRGSSCLFVLGVTDAMTALLMQVMVGGRQGLTGIPGSSSTNKNK